MVKKKKYKPKPFESTGLSSDTSANIYESMLLSPAFKNLTTRQKLLYLYCKSQYYSEKTVDKPNPFAFTMNRNKWLKKYELYSDSNAKQFYKDIEGLINHGFIKCIRGGKLIRVKNIYEFSDKWKCWDTSAFVIKDNELTYNMQIKKYNS